MELVLITLKTLPEEIIVFNADMIEQRRKDILEGMKLALDTVFPFFAQVWLILMVVIIHGMF